ncbi:uncharacterized protein LOC131597126 [Vicia villosa]|uniref:uncharacterized protein LOC131597126 n=1 Tax=Vicia villosa TaxID=3911 RepID=UPI00273AA8B7|nr:uncharacterized protein LOC131597126 [Vicia villosa]
MTFLSRERAMQDIMHPNLLSLFSTKANINLKGIAIENPLLEFNTDFNSIADFLWLRGHLSSSTYEMLKSVCDYATIKRQHRTGEFTTKKSSIPTGQSWMQMFQNHSCGLESSRIAIDIEVVVHHIDLVVAVAWFGTGAVVIDIEVAVHYISLVEVVAWSGTGAVVIQNVVVVEVAYFQAWR